jgi:predicted signal transduction protein with EAL and GGDEF domain
MRQLARLRAGLAACLLPGLVVLLMLLARPLPGAQTVLVLGRVSDDPKAHHARLQPLVDYVAARMGDLGIRESRVLMARDAQQMVSDLRQGKVDWIGETSVTAAHRALRRDRRRNRADAGRVAAERAARAGGDRVLRLGIRGQFNLLLLTTALALLGVFAMGAPTASRAVEEVLRQNEQALDTAARQALAEHRLAAALVHVELTESSLVHDEEQAFALLGELRESGVEVWLCDFGTGFSALSHLRRARVDGVKIDRSFVADLSG